MSEQLINWVATETSIKQNIVQKVIDLIQEGNTVPFIARYRKEATGGLDEVQIKSVHDQWTYAVNLKERKEEVIRLIDEQGKLTPELKAEIEAATQLQRIDDLYRPYRKKRRTRATIAKEKGLEPLAEMVWKQEDFAIEGEAKKYFSEEHELTTMADVMAGVNDIIAEWISDDPKFREHIRKETLKHGQMVSEVRDEEADAKGVFEMYYEYHEAIRSIVSHRILALNRGEKEKVLRVVIEPPVEQLIEFLEKEIIHVTNECAPVIKEAIADGYKRLIQPSIEREVRNYLTEKAEKQAINVFSENLKNLLLQPPLKGRTVLGVDPAYQAGCKLSLVDETGKMLAVQIIYPTPPRKDVAGAEKVIVELTNTYDVELIAIGNGTASRETEQFIADVLQKNGLDIPYLIVDEAGASVYSASDLAREEFPDLDVEERSAVSIARRVQDPLAELVKIDPKSIGVGQYQHDVSQNDLTESLSFVVETTVNQVGVNVNTASAALLQYVSGLNKTVADNIVNERNELGKFTNRRQLKEVPRLGPKTYEQGIGFLRILEGDHPLDRTPIHPESYKHTEALLAMIDCSVEDVGTEKLRKALDELSLEEISEELDIGLPTLQDITNALKRPERDPRDDLPQPLLKHNILTLEDLEEGMELQGTVRNVVDFGVFVDIGVQDDGLVHISKMANHYVKHPMDLVSVGDVITVWVLDVDVARGRISLSMVE